MQADATVRIRWRALGVLLPIPFLDLGCYFCLKSAARLLDMRAASRSTSTPAVGRAGATAARPQSTVTSTFLFQLAVWPATFVARACLSARTGLAFA